MPPPFFSPPLRSPQQRPQGHNNNNNKYKYEYENEQIINGELSGLCNGR